MVILEQEFLFLLSAGNSGHMVAAYRAQSNAEPTALVDWLCLCLGASLSR